MQRFEGGKAEVMDWLRAKSVSHVRVEWSDINGIARGKRVPLTTFEHVIGGAGLPFAAVLLGVDIQARVVPGTPFGDEIGFGDFMAHPDLSSLRLINHEPNAAQAMSDLRWPDGRLVESHPRQVLRKALDDLEALGFSAYSAPEFEFYILDEEGELVDSGIQAYSLQKRSAFLEEEAAMIDTLSAYGDYEAANYEYGPGQYEINIRYSDAMTIADAGHLLRCAMKETAIGMGRRITFMAKPFEGKTGNSCHVHLSLTHSDGSNAFYDPDDPLRINQTCRHFIGGILDHLHEVTAVYLPNPNSYRRIVPDNFAPISRAWGIDNRTAAVRVLNETPEGTRVELRVCGGDINIYLVLAALVASGIDGLKNKIDPGPPSKGNLDQQEIERITDDWAVALGRFEQSNWVPAALGEEFCRVFILIKRFEHARFKRTVTEFERAEYLEFL